MSFSGSDTSVWEDARWKPLPALNSPAQTDVCVIGLGGSGLTCINTLLSLGKSVVGIDAVSVGGGAAGRNGGFLLAGMAGFYHDVVNVIGREKARGIYRLTLDTLDRIQSETPSVVRRDASLRIAASDREETDCRRQLSAMQADGFAVEEYEGPEGTGLLIPGDGSFHPLARCRLLALQAIETGASLHEQTRAVSIGENVVRTGNGSTIECENVIVAVDGHVEALLPELSGRVRTARLQMLATEPVPRIVASRPVYFRYGYDYWQQLPDGRIVVGGCRDQEGEEEWTTSSATSSGIQGRLEMLLREQIGVSEQITHRWAALASYTHDEIPLLEEVRPGVLVVGAYSGTGNVMGALYGRIAAEVVATGESGMAGMLPSPADYARQSLRR